MELEINVFSKHYKCYYVEQPGRAKGTRYKAYGDFEGQPLSAQGYSPEAAINKLKRKAEIALDY